jgi:hypothetical protein
MFSERFRLLIRGTNTRSAPVRNLPLIRYAFCAVLGAHCYRLLVARRYKASSLLCFTAAKKMFQLTAFVEWICNFSQNIVIFLIGSIAPKLFSY